MLVAVLEYGLLLLDSDDSLFAVSCWEQGLSFLDADASLLAVCRDQGLSFSDADTSLFVVLRWEQRLPCSDADPAYVAVVDSAERHQAPREEQEVGVLNHYTQPAHGLLFELHRQALPRSTLAPVFVAVQAVAAETAAEGDSAANSAKDLAMVVLYIDSTVRGTFSWVEAFRPALDTAYDAWPIVAVEVVGKDK